MDWFYGTMAAIGFVALAVLVDNIRYALRLRKSRNFKKVPRRPTNTTLSLPDTTETEAEVYARALDQIHKAACSVAPRR